jgi:hypothetical protein
MSTRVCQSVGAGQPWWHGAIQGLLEGSSVGFMAMGWWSAGGKEVANRKSKKAAKKSKAESKQPASVPPPVPPDAV